jgi:ribosomal protein S18 acetylase RimI-like enzyme
MASMAQAVEANLFTFFRVLAAWPRVEIHDDVDCFWTLSDLRFPLFNSVLRAGFAPEAADAGIAARIQACRERGVAMLWWTGPSSTPYDLIDRLDRHGFVMEPARGMAADLRAVAAGPAADASVAVAAVEDAPALRTWSRVLCDAFGAPPAFGHSFAELASSIGLGPGSSFRHFLAFLDGEPAATGSLFLGAGVAGLYDVATLPEMRRRGLGGAVTRAMLAEAARRGYRTAILHASGQGASLYRSLGFTDVCAIGQHVWVPEGLRRRPAPGGSATAAI